MSYLVREYDGIIGKLVPTIKPLLRPHLEDMEVSKAAVRIAFMFICRKYVWYRKVLDLPQLFVG